MLTSCYRVIHLWERAGKSMGRVRIVFILTLGIWHALGSVMEPTVVVGKVGV